MFLKIKYTWNYWHLMDTYSLILKLIIIRIEGKEINAASDHSASKLLFQNLYFCREKNFEKKSHNDEKLKGGPFEVFQHPFCRKT